MTAEFNKYTHEEIIKFYEEWPGGLDEVNSSIKGWRERAERLEAVLRPLVAESRELLRFFESGNEVPVERATIRSEAVKGLRAAAVRGWLCLKP